MTAFTTLLAALLAAQAPGAASSPGNAVIDYAGGGGIRDWHAEDARGIFLRDRANRWYYAAFRHPCPGVLYDDQIRFKTDVLNRFDRLSQVLTQTETCAVQSLDRSEAPKAKGGRAANARRRG